MRLHLLDEPCASAKGYTAEGMTHTCTPSPSFLKARARQIDDLSTQLNWVPIFKRFVSAGSHKHTSARVPSKRTHSPKPSFNCTRSPVWKVAASSSSSLSFCSSFCSCCRVLSSRTFLLHQASVSFYKDSLTIFTSAKTKNNLVIDLDRWTLMPGHADVFKAVCPFLDQFVSALMHKAIEQYLMLLQPLPQVLLQVVFRQGCRSPMRSNKQSQMARRQLLRLLYRAQRACIYAIDTCKYSEQPLCTIDGNKIQPLSCHMIAFLIEE